VQWAGQALPHGILFGSLVLEASEKVDVAHKDSTRDLGLGRAPTPQKKALDRSVSRCHRFSMQGREREVCLCL
jgi:hypothetical protein